MTNALSTTSAFNGVVSALVQIAEGEVLLRKSVADYVNAGGTVKELHVQLQNLDDQRCHKSYSYLRQIQSRCRQVGLLPEVDKHSHRELVSARPVENPEQLSQLLPTQRDVKAYAKAPVEVKEQIVTLANLGPYHAASPAAKDKIMEMTGDGSFPEVEKVHPGTYGDRMVEYVRSLIDHENYEINTSNNTDEQKDDMIMQLNTTLEAIQGTLSVYNMQTKAYFGGFDDKGRYDWYEWLTIIKNVSKELSDSERISAIKHLMSQLDESARQKLVDSILSPIN